MSRRKLIELDLTSCNPLLKVTGTKVEPIAHRRTCSTQPQLLIICCREIASRQSPRQERGLFSRVPSNTLCKFPNVAMAPTLESTDIKNKLEDLSGVVIKPGENPYNALIEACGDDPVSFSSMYCSLQGEVCDIIGILEERPSGSAVTRYCQLSS